eukprot:Nk52_evm1s966 gene=Nk52_evmTU1s966
MTVSLGNEVIQYGNISQEEEEEQELEEMRKSNTNGDNQQQCSHKNDQSRVSFSSSSRSSSSLSRGSTDLPLWRVIVTALAWIGIQIVWTLEFAIAVPFFTERLHFQKFSSMLMWSFGPVMGITVAPVVGALSDQCTSSWGPRRPFILAGMCLTVLFSFVFALSAYLPGGGEGQGRTGQLPVASALAVFSFAMMDMFMNVSQGPQRTILADMAALREQAVMESNVKNMNSIGSRNEQHVVQTFASLFQGIGQIIGFFLIPVVGGDHPVDNVLAIVVVASVFIVGTTTPGLCVAKEIPLQSESSPLPQRTKRPIWLLSIIRTTFKELWQSLSQMPADMVKVCLVQGCSFLALFCFNPILTAWFANVIYEANAVAIDDSSSAGPVKDALMKEHSERYNAGVNMGSYAGVVQAICQIAFSYCVPFLVKRVGMKYAYLLAMLPLAVCLLLCALVPLNAHVAVLLVGLTGVSLAGQNIFPYALTARIFSKKNHSPAAASNCVEGGIMTGQGGANLDQMGYTKVIDGNHRGTEAEMEESSPQDMDEMIEESNYHDLEKQALCSTNSSHPNDRRQMKGSNQRLTKHLGVNMGIINIFVTVPQLFSTLFASWLVHVSESENVVVLVGGIFGMATVVAIALLLKDEGEEKEEEEDDDDDE